MTRLAATPPCDKCGQDRKTRQVDGANGPWLCAACFMTYTPAAVRNASAHLNSGRRRQSSLGPKAIGNDRDQGDARTAGMQRGSLAVSAGTLPSFSSTSRAPANAFSATRSLENAPRGFASSFGSSHGSSDGNDPFLDMVRPMPAAQFTPFVPKRTKPRLTEPPPLTLAEPLSASRSRPENHRGLLDVTSPQSESQRAKRTAKLPPPDESVLNREERDHPSRAERSQRARDVRGHRAEKEREKRDQRDRRHEEVSDRDRQRGAAVPDRDRRREVSVPERERRHKESPERDRRREDGPERDRRHEEVSERDRRHEELPPDAWPREATPPVSNDVPSPLSPPADIYAAPACCSSGEAELPGGFRRRDRVRSLLSRERRNMPMLELGHEGEVVAMMPSTPRGREMLADVPCLLVQFKCGFDWLLAPHQICLLSDYDGIRSQSLPGGYKWGDRVRTVVDHLSNPNSQRGLVLGASGIVIGPGHTRGKLAIRFDDGVGEWNIWPGVICRAEAYPSASCAKITDGFHRGDRVRARVMISAVCNAIVSCVQIGQEGTVMGAGHADGRVLVKFDIGGRTWSLTPSQISGCERVSRFDDGEGWIDVNSRDEPELAGSAPSTWHISLCT